MITALIHTYNEEKNIDRCLSSLAFADEIVIIDMGSSDNTLSYAQKYKPKIYNHPYMGFVEPARNFGISKANGDWILIVDADEEIPLKLSKILREKSRKSEYDFYRISRKNMLFGKWIKHTGWWPDYQIRFFRKGCVFWTEKIHGIPQTTGRGFDFSKEENYAILHHNYQNLEQYMFRLNRYSGIAANEIYSSGTFFKSGDLFLKPLKEFVTRFFIWEGYKDGIHGLALSALQSFSETVTYLKVWEKFNYKEEKLDLRIIKKEFENEYKVKKFWIISALLKLPHSFIESLLWKLQRKL
jgi:glycosyltransferase involved in cell wall biosynthesis